MHVVPSCLSSQCNYDTFSHTVVRFPADVELEGSRNYLAGIPLADYGPSITLPDEDHEALCSATDDFSLSSLKVQYNVFCFVNSYWWMFISQV